MSRFPASRITRVVFQILAMLSVAGGVIVAVEDQQFAVRLGAIPAGLLAALLFWTGSELITMALSIESNTFLMEKMMARSATASWTPASSRPPLSSPDTGSTSV